MQYYSTSRKIFAACNYVFLILLSLSCIFPLIHVLAISFSSRSAATAGLVSIRPVEFTTAAYRFVLDNPDFIRALVVSLERVVLGTAITMLLIVLIAYPLSKEQNAFGLRTVYAWFFVFTMIFSGGLIPLFITVKMTGLLDTLWALIFPTWGLGANIFNVVLLLNFFRVLPKELEEAAFMDGAGHWTTLWRIYLPLSKPAIATVSLFTMVFNWNSWFDGLIFMNNPAHYPLQTYLQTSVLSENLLSQMMSGSNMEILQLISDRTTKAAQIFIGALPILLVYPFLQRYFMKGIVLGSVKE